jgi:uncharacterized protein (TIGR02266 family)
MADHDRIPYSVYVEFRTAASFLVAYSVNLSRGGLFVETDAELPTGVLTNLELSVPGAGQLPLIGIISWRRGPDSPDGPPGIGIELPDVGPVLGAAIDRLVATFRGVQIVLLSGDRQDRTTLARSIKSIIATAEIRQAADAATAASLLTGETDLAVVDVDFDADAAVQILRAAKQLSPRVPAVALTANAKLRELARAAGADELATNPPPFSELQVVLVRALSKPAVVRSSGGA